MEAVLARPTYGESIERFLFRQEQSASRWYHSELETRVFPRELSDDESDELFEEGIQQKSWKYSFPDDDRQVTDPSDAWSLDLFAGRIGTSGWNYAQGTAEFATFEFDYGHGSDARSKQELDAIRDALESTGLCEIRRSTHGKGLHCRVQFTEPIAVANRGEYSSLNRVILDTLGKQCGIDLFNLACGVGCILWIWANTATPENRGFELVCEQSQLFSVPDNWRDSVPKTTVHLSQEKVVTLDEKHQEILDYLQSNGFTVRRQSLPEGGECFATHTCGIKKAHSALKLVGDFETDSLGRNPTDPNCYMIPRDGGGFQVFRYGSASESTWNTRASDGRAWCWFNQFVDDDWSQLCERFGGVRQSANRTKNYILPNFQAAADVVSAAGGNFPIPSNYEREVILTILESGIQCGMVRERGEPTPDQWTKQSDRRFGCFIPTAKRQHDRQADSTVDGFTIGYHFNDAGKQDGATLFFVRHRDDNWKLETEGHFRAAMESAGYSPKRIKEWIGQQLLAPKKITTEPFQIEHPAPDVWNRGYKLACKPEPGEFPHWQMILDHTGNGLTPLVQQNDWCKANGITTGGEYLTVYCAVTVQTPGTRLPFLGLWSLENAAGKNTFPDSFALLMEPGAVVAIDNALINSSGFNGELEGGVIYTVHETDLSKTSTTAYNRIKELVTDPWITIHPKGHKPYKVRNWGRIIQTSNHLEHFVAGFDDERIVIIPLSKIDPNKLIDWSTKLQPALTQERAAFLHHLLSMQLPSPAPGSRCFLPILNTVQKQTLIDNSLPELSEQQSAWLDKILEIGGWNGLKTLPEVNELLPTTPTGNAGGRKWSHTWQKLEKHLIHAGFRPIYRPFVKTGPNKALAAWGFDNPELEETQK